MKTIIAIPETKDEWKAVWTNNKKKIVGGLAAVGAIVAGAALTHGKLWGDDGTSDCDDPDAGYLPEPEENDVDWMEQNSDEDEQEGLNESGGGAE